jgi:hypothetical protein
VLHFLAQILRNLDGIIVMDLEGSEVLRPADKLQSHVMIYVIS